MNERTNERMNEWETVSHVVLLCACLAKFQRQVNNRLLICFTDSEHLL